MHRDLDRQNTVLVLRPHSKLDIGQMLFQVPVILKLILLCLHEKIAPLPFSLNRRFVYWKLSPSLLKSMMLNPSLLKSMMIENPVEADIPF